MNTLTIIIVAILGIAFGVYLGRRKGGVLVVKEGKKKRKKKAKVLKYFDENERVTNNDIEKLLGVSDATATRYLDELEKEGKVQQVGERGKYVYYVLK